MHAHCGASVFLVCLCRAGERGKSRFPCLQVDGHGQVADDAAVRLGRIAGAQGRQKLPVLLQGLLHPAGHVQRPLGGQVDQVQQPLELLVKLLVFGVGHQRQVEVVVGLDKGFVVVVQLLGVLHILADFALREHIIIGTTEDNGAVLAPGHVRRGGEGRTNVGMLTPDGDNFLPRLQQAFDSCGFQVRIHENIQQLIWEKLFTNVSLSAVTGILQVDMGFIAADEYAWALTRTLLHEAVCTAAAAGLTFDEEALAEKVRSTSRNNPQGCTSIRADLAAGRRTEVDTISGAVVRAAGKYGVAVPCHEFVVRMVHAMEDRHKGGTV